MINKSENIKNGNSLTKTRHMVFLALMVSIALVLSIVESWLPVPQPVPGIKLGLANIITVIVITFYGYRDTLMVVCARCILASLYTGGLMSFFFSFTGGMLSAAVMAFIYKKASGVFSLTGISIVGAVFHNVGQILVACLIMKDITVLAYLPVLLVSGIVTGFFVGLCSRFFSDTIRKSGIINKPYRSFAKQSEENLK
ncbi:MAG: Gx transporter family protein [Bacillota bacterium]|nr:Gx transporter family protein [Bacillota bacterium]